MLALSSAAVLMLVRTPSAVLPAAYFVMGSSCLLIPGKKRFYAGMVCAALLFAMGFQMTPWRETVWLLMIPAGYAALLFYTLPIGGWTHDTELPFSVFFGGCFAFVVAQLAAMLKPDWYAPTAGWLLVSFLGYGALWMLALNRQSLADAAAHGKRAPQEVRRRNLLLTIGLMVLVLLVAAIPALARAMAWAWERLKELISLIGRLLLALMPEPTAAGGSGGGGGMEMLAGEAAQPAVWLQVLEKVVMALVMIGLAVALFFVLRLLWRKLRVLLSRLWKVLGRYAQAASEDYVDEVADTRTEDQSVSASRRNRFGDWLRQVNEDRLTPAERIRYRYRRLVRRHEEWSASSTARENIPSDAATLYERARYASHPLTAEEAERFAKQAKQLEKKA